MAEKSQRGFALLIIILIVAIAGGGVYTYIQSNQTNQATSTESSAGSKPTISRIEVIEGLPVGKVEAGGRATIFGTNLSSVVSVKIGDKVGLLSGSFGDADQGVFSTQQTFKVPELPAGVYNVSVTDSSGQVSNSYHVTVVEPVPSKSDSSTFTAEKVVQYFYKSLQQDNKANWSPFIIINGSYRSIEANSGARLDVSSFGFGDIDGNGYEDAVFAEHSCGVSCSIGLHIALQQPDGTLSIMAAGGVPLVASGAGKTDIQSIKIQNGKISITARGFSTAPSYDPAMTEIFTFDGKRLVPAP